MYFDNFEVSLCNGDKSIILSKDSIIRVLVTYEKDVYEAEYDGYFCGLNFDSHGKIAELKILTDCFVTIVIPVDIIEDILFYETIELNINKHNQEDDDEDITD